MNGKDIFLGMKYIGEDLIDEAEYGSLSQKSRAEKEVRRHSLRRPLLIAAVIALMVALVGCAVAYVLSLENVKIKNATEERNVFADNGYEVVGTETVDVSVLSLAGLKGTPAYQACADFYAYEAALRQEMETQIAAGNPPEDGTFTNALSVKAGELAKSYGLKPEGETLKFRTVRTLCDALGVERFFRETEGIVTDITWGGANENGNFSLILNMYFPTDAVFSTYTAPSVLRWNWKDSFSSDYITIDDTGDWTEKHYTTSSGNDILILYSPSNEYGYLLCDRGEALMSLEFTYRSDAWNQEGDRVWADSYYMTEKQMELMAETVDFNIQPKRVTQADVEAQAAPSQEATQNGWTLKLKEVDTDGYVAHIVVSVTAPEGTVLDDKEQVYSLHNGNHWAISPLDGRESSGGQGGGFSGADDGDGLSNTMDFVMDADLTMVDGSAPFGIGSQWQIHIVDIAGYSTAGGQVQEVTLVEGEWQFTITFDETNGDYREIELVQEPFTAKACTGWYPDGTDAVEDYTVTSFVLRKYSSTIDYAEKKEYIYPDFYSYDGKWMYAVMKDGTKTQMLGYHDALDLSQVDHILFPDGTTLPVPNP